jgi:TonB-linked SusC/RagA family outer membrane protein
MKMIFILTVAFCFTVNAEGFSQKISLSLKNAPIEKVFKEITNQTGMSFFYTESQIRKAKRISVQLNNVSVEEALNACFEDQVLTFQIVNKLIIVKAKEPVTVNEKPIEEASLPPPAQIIKGTITDEEGKPLKDVSVMVKGTNIGTRTGENGSFQIEIPDGAAKVLVVSYVGMDSQEINVSSNTTVSVKMLPSTKLQDDLVVVGYGTKKRENLTGALSTVSAKEIESRPIGNTQQALQGLVPNLNLSVSNAGGEPGAGMAMNIRGLQSFGGSNAPFVLVDHVPMDINSIDPSTIESVTVLKDAASTAIYGARAAYGVILITTKSGKKSKSNANVTFSMNLGLAEPVQFPRMVGTMEFAHAMNDAARNQGSAPWYNQDALDRLAKNIANPGSAPVMYGRPDGQTWDIGTMGLGAADNTDWYSILMKDQAFRQKYNLGISGANDKVDYYFNVGWYDEEGLLRYGGESFNRYNFDAKVGAQATNWARISVLFKYNQAVQEFPWEQDLGRGRIYDMITKLKPTMPAKYPGTDIWTQESRIAEWQALRDNTTLKQMVIAPRIIITPLKDWVINLEFNYTQNNDQQELSATEWFWMRPNGQLAPGIPKPNTSYRPRINTSNYLSPNLYTSYTKSIKKHDFTVLAGYQQETFRYFNIKADATYLLSNNVPAINTAVGTKTVEDGKGHWGTQSFFGRLNYAFDNKYLFEANFRADGSSRFEPDDRWGYFPSVSAGWVFSEENFFPLKKAVDFLKFRASFGQLGNQNVPNYLYIPTMGIAQSNYLFGPDRLWAVTAPNLSSVNLTWETVSTLDFGVDFRMFRNRFSTSFDWYESHTGNLVGPGVALPAVLGTAVPLENSGEVKTTGFELELKWRDKIGNVQYEIGGNLANNKSVVTKYNNPDKVLTTYYEGMVLGELWGYETAGLFQTQAEVNNWVNQSFIYSGRWEPGDLKYIDQDKDGKIGIGRNTATDHGDKRIIGNQLPQYMYGFNAAVFWKGFDFSVFFQGVAKQTLYITEIFNGNVYRGPANGPFHAMVYEGQLDYWRDDKSALGPNPNAFFAKPYSVFTGNNDKNYGNPTDRFTPSGAYLRLKNLRIGYTIPPRITNKVRIANVKAYISGENILTFSQLKILDPEQTGGRNGDGRTYPLSKVWSFGLNVNF